MYFFRRWRRSRLAKRELPAEWLPIIEEHYPFARELSPDERERFLTHLKVFVWSIQWIGAAGLDVTDEMKVVIAGAAARIARRLPFEVYDRLSEVVVYPDTYVDPREEHRSGARLGEAHRWGVVVLSWDAVNRGIAYSGDGRDTAIHEFAHVLDAEDGAFDGTPVLEHGTQYAAWSRVLGEHFERLRAAPFAHFLDSYGATDEAEFFAVATETFFEQPAMLKRRAPDLYEQLRSFFGVDPADEAA